MLEKIEKAFNVEQVDKTMGHKKALYDLFIQRPSDTKISATDILSFEEHEKFVENHPYRYWFLLKIKTQKMPIIPPYFDHRTPPGERFTTTKAHGTPGEHPLRGCVRAPTPWML